MPQGLAVMLIGDATLVRGKSFKLEAENAVHI
jgi:hypothetical protein